jgi:hypothetical protein
VHGLVDGSHGADAEEIRENILAATKRRPSPTACTFLEVGMVAAHGTNEDSPIRFRMGVRERRSNESRLWGASVTAAQETRRLYLELRRRMVCFMAELTTLELSTDGLSDPSRAFVDEP